MKYRAALTIGLIVALNIPLHATSVRRLGFDDLVTRAGSIIEGSVIGSQTYRSGDGKLILTSYTIKVQETLKGRAQQTLTITTIGGKIGNTILHVSGMPAFSPGEKAILFLEQSQSYTTVVGLNQGKFAISNNEVSNSVDGLSFPDALPGKPVKMPLDEFKRQIKRRLPK